MHNPVQRYMVDYPPFILLSFWFGRRTPTYNKGMATFQVTPPENFSFTHPEEWPKWIRRYERRGAISFIVWATRRMISYGHSVYLRKIQKSTVSCRAHLILILSLGEALYLKERSLIKGNNKMGNCGCFYNGSLPAG